MRPATVLSWRLIELFILGSLALVPSPHSLALPVSFDYELLSNVVAGDGDYLYQYLVFPVDHGPGYEYGAPVYIADIFPGGQAAHDSVDWDSLKAYSNMAPGFVWEAGFEHGLIEGPMPSGQYWGDLWRVPDVACDLTVDGNGISFVDPDTLDWGYFGYQLRLHATDPCDPFLAYSFRSSLPPELGQWFVVGDDGYYDSGTKWVPQKRPPWVPVVSEASCIAGLAALLGGLTLGYRRWRGGRR